MVGDLGRCGRNEPDHDPPGKARSETEKVRIRSVFLSNEFVDLGEPSKNVIGLKFDR